MDIRQSQQDISRAYVGGGPGVFVSALAWFAAAFVERSQGIGPGFVTLFVGGMLIYGAFNPLQRPLVLIVAGASKVVFIALVLSEGARYLSHQAGVAVAIDSVMVVLFGWYLVAARSVAVRAEAEPTDLSV